MRRIVHGSESVCPKCGGMLIINMDVGDGYLYDNCGGFDGCGFKRKKTKDGQEVTLPRVRHG